MKVYAVADIHADKARLDRIEQNIASLSPDCLVVGGDMINWVKGTPVYARFNRLPVPVLAICGNTDPFAQEKRLRRYSNIRSLHLKKLNFDGISFFGIGGTIPVPFRSRMRLFERSLIRGVEPLIDMNTLLVVHPPPYGTLDRVMGRFSAGSKAVAEIVRRYRPRVLVCGHIHEDSGSAYLSDTLVVNCAMGRGCEGALITVDADRSASVEMIYTERG